MSTTLNVQKVGTVPSGFLAVDNTVTLDEMNATVTAKDGENVLWTATAEPLSSADGVPIPDLTYGQANGCSFVFYRRNQRIVGIAYSTGSSQMGRGEEEDPGAWEADDGVGDGHG